jgi:hypothetical protein
MSRKAKWVLAVATFLCLLACGAAYVALLPRSQISRDNAAKVEVGMDLATVEAILGGPPRADYDGELMADNSADEDVVIKGDIGPSTPPEGGLGRVRYWASDTVTVAVRTDGNERIACVVVRAVRPLPVLTRLRRWLGL